MLVDLSDKLTKRNSELAGEISRWRLLLDAMLDLNYSQARDSVLHFVSRHYSISSLAWLERHGNHFETFYASGELHSQTKFLNISADDKRLLDAVERETSFELREHQEAKKNAAPSINRFFPITVGKEIRSALIVRDQIASEDKKYYLTLFCRAIASNLEILRLREELNRHDWLKRAVRKFNESVNDVEANDFWSDIVQTFAKLMRAERSSLLLFDEQSNFFSAKAATGSRADVIKKETDRLGDKIARKVLQYGEPLIVRDVRKTETFAAPAEWDYKSNSFICYPLIIGPRRIGVLNVADRSDGENFSELDLQILQGITPQLAVLIHSASLKERMSEFEQLSVTDAHTGLLNRLYLNERLPEEIRRSNREGCPMSFLMIDVDDFKPYNDSFGHPDGDRALKLVAYCLKDTLRNADVAVRYGGEEFSILLPQTASDQAVKIAERIRKKVAATEFPNRQVTISVGVASCLNLNCTAEEIIKWADEALYEAKRRGRNNVRLYENLSESQTRNAKITDAKTLRKERRVLSGDELTRIGLQKEDYGKLFLAD
jgi:diguanylate cyclase (GGDEF)-like protein